jgi:hypothetical protein
MPEREKPVPGIPSGDQPLSAVPSAGAPLADVPGAAVDAASMLHQAIQQQIAELLANSSLSEDEKQQILVAMQCPCCAAGGLSLSIKLGPPRGTPSF